MNTRSHACPECSRQNLYKTSVNSAGNHGPVLLPGLGGFLRYAKFDVVICRDCGHTRFFAEPSARTKLSTSSRWTRL